MADWEGFTEADLRKIQSGSDLNRGDQRPKILKPVTGKRTTASTNKSRPTAMGKRQAARKAQTPASNISSAAMLSQPAPSSANKSKPIDEASAPRVAAQSPPPPLASNTVTSAPNPEKEDTFVIDDESVQKKEKLKLEDVHQRQKQMEEKNRRKKAMLTKEIAERKKKASAESSKLLKIQSELTKLDHLLNMDVSVLRDRIDDACMEFSHAQKRFERAEAEYIASKIELHHKTTMKEDLTEHLFNLIQANEERKAKKLEELMNKLDVEEEELEAHEKKRRENEKKEEAMRIDHEKSAESTKEVTKPASSLTSDPIPDAVRGETKVTDATSPESEKTSSHVNGESLHGATSSKIAAS